MQRSKVSIRFTFASHHRATQAHKPLNVRDERNREQLLHTLPDVLPHKRTRDSMKSILDPSFRYTKSVDTDLRKTFARIRREQQRQARANGADHSGVVLTLGTRKARAVA
jgi:hypothetical protein